MDIECRTALEGQRAWAVSRGATNTDSGQQNMKPHLSKCEDLKVTALQCDIARRAGAAHPRARAQLSTFEQSRVERSGLYCVDLFDSGGDSAGSEDAEVPVHPARGEGRAALSAGATAAPCSGHCICRSTRSQTPLEH